ALAMAWNLGSLIVLGTGQAGFATEITVALSFSVLSLLPAVLLDLSLEGRSRTLSRAGDALAAGGIGLHLAELFRREEFFHVAGLVLITIGFGLLTIIAAADVFRGREHVSSARLAGSRPIATRLIATRLIATMALFLLAMSFVHFGGDAQQIWS